MESPLSPIFCAFDGLTPCDGEVVRFAGVLICRKHLRQLVRCAWANAGLD